MAWTNIPGTYNLVSRAADVLYQERYSYNQVNSGFQSFAPDVWIQRDRDGLARQAVAEINNIKRWLGTYPAPTWSTHDVFLDTYRAYTGQTLRLPVGNIQAFGKRAITALEADSSVLYSGDVGTVTVTTLERTTGRIAAFLRVTDGALSAGDVRFEIPLESVSYNAGAYTLTFHKADGVKPNLNSVDFVGGDPKKRNALSYADAATYVDAVDVYHVYNDDSVKAELLTYPRNDETDVQTYAINATITDARIGTFKLNIADNTVPQTTPYAVRVHAYSGIAYDDATLARMAQPVEEVILARCKANAPMNTRLSIAPANSEMYIFGDVNANNDARGEGYVPNPIGTRNVDVWTYRKLYGYALEGGMMLDRRWNVT